MPGGEEPGLCDGYGRGEKEGGEVKGEDSSWYGKDNVLFQMPWRPMNELVFKT